MAAFRVTREGPALDEVRELFVVDPVCGREVGLDRSAAQEDQEGWAYFFCLHRCKRLFSVKPGRFARTVPSEISGEPR